MQWSSNIQEQQQIPFKTKCQRRKNFFNLVFFYLVIFFLRVKLKYAIKSCYRHHLCSFTKEEGMENILEQNK